MAITTFSLLLTTLSLLHVTTSTMAATSHNNQELTLRDLNSAIFTLRSNGFNLFANSISVSDLSFQLLSTTSAVHGGTHGGGEGHRGYTLLAPPNTALFSLDMSTDAFTYVNSLRCHVIPRRLTFSELQNVSRSSEPFLETLTPGHLVDVSSAAVYGGVNGGVTVSIDGVLISFPDMHLQPKIAVHGLDGILVSSAARVDELGFVTAPQPFAGDFSTEIAEVPSPVSSFASFTVGSEFGSVFIPPAGYYSSEISESSSETPSPSPACSGISDCQNEVMSPYIWPPTASDSSLFSPSYLIDDFAEFNQDEFVKYNNGDDEADFDQSLAPIINHW